MTFRLTVKTGHVRKSRNSNLELRGIYQKLSLHEFCDLFYKETDFQTPPFSKFNLQGNKGYRCLLTSPFTSERLTFSCLSLDETQYFLSDNIVIISLRTSSSSSFSRKPYEFSHFRAIFCGQRPTTTEKLIKLVVILENHRLFKFFPENLKGPPFSSNLLWKVSHYH